MEEFKKGRSILLMIFGIIYFIFWCLALVLEWWDGFVETEGEFIFYSFALFFLFVIATGVNVIINVLIEIGKNTKNVGKEVVTTQPHTINGDVSSLKKKRCDNCGYELSAAQNSCPNCGRKCN